MLFKVFVAYLAGDAVIVPNNTCWMGLVTEGDSRILLGMGRNKL